MDFSDDWLDLSYDSPRKSAWAVPVDFSDFSDDDLLDAPAHLLAARIREAATGGARVIIADPVSTYDAVYRIPDIEATPNDYKPHLDWDDVIDPPPALPNSYGVNTTLINKSIPYRVVEPELPERTKITAYEATAGDVSLSPIEKCVVRGYSAIQVVQKAGGDAFQLALALNAAWGNAQIFDPNFRADFLGGVSLARYLAKTGKRRFQLYRNIGWLSIVKPGVSIATASSYGENAVINWQRRTELACYFVHIATMLEGQNFPLGSNFSITARIPDFSVSYANWDDCAMSIDASNLLDQNVPLIFQQIAEELMHGGLNKFIYNVASVIKQNGGDFHIDKDMLTLASKYQKLTFIEPYRAAIVKAEASLNRKSDLAYSKREAKFVPKSIKMKSHDPATAVMEALLSSNEASSSSYGYALTAYLQELAKMRKDVPVSEEIHLVKLGAQKLLHFRPVLQIVANNLQLPTKIRFQKQWKKYVDFNLPAHLISEDDPLATLANITAHALVILDKSKAYNTLTFHHKQIAQKLEFGIRSKEHVLYNSVHQIQTVIMSDIDESTKHVYNHRYRSRASAYKDFSDLSKVEAVSRRAYFVAVKWYLIADLVMCTHAKLHGKEVRIDLNEARTKRALHAAAASIKHKMSIESPKTQNMRWLDAVEAYQAWIVDKKIPYERALFWDARDRLKLYIKEHLPDFGPELKVEELDLGPQVQLDIGDIVQPTYKDIPDQISVANAMMHVLGVSGDRDVLDDDQIDSMEVAIKKQLAASNGNEEAWALSKFAITKSEVAKAEVTKWLDLVEEEEDENESEVY